MPEAQIIQEAPPPKKQKDLARATVVGFSRIACKKCHGRGRAGFDAKYRDQAHVIPCECVEFFDIEIVQRSQKEAALNPELVDVST